MSAVTWIGVLALGGTGAVLRFLIDEAISSRVRGDFPLGTLLVNLSGAAALGLVTGLSVTGDALVLAGTATLGSYTTFSTWMFETQRRQESGAWMGAVANTSLSLALGIAAIALGRALGTAL